MNINNNDDYAAIETDEVEFYYGYEEVDDDGNWCFVARENSNEVMRKTSIELTHSVSKNQRPSEPVEYLLCGIGLWVEEFGL